MSAAVTEPMVPVPYRIQHVRRETYDTFTLELKPASGVAPIAFAAGQFNMLYVFGVGEVPISISGDPGNRDLLVHTTRMVGATTKAMGQLKPGDTLGVRGPFGTGWPVEQAVGHDVLILAGGIGLPPLRPAIYHVLAHRERYGKVTLLYGARTPADLMFRKQLEQWRARFDMDVFVTVDRGDATWRGHVGVVTTLIPKAGLDPAKTIAMMVGPEIMMRFTLLELEKLQMPTDRIYLSMERNMKCGVCQCGHCQLGPSFVCKDGPVYRYSQVKDLLAMREI